MARFGTWKPLAGNWAAQSRMTQVDIISLHTMVGNNTTTDNMWRRTGYTGNHSHFGVGGNGEIVQWQDTDYRAAANFNGNWHIISVECADYGAPFAPWNMQDGNAVPGFTPAQFEALAQLIAAMCKAHNIPCATIPDARPGRRGIGWHRLGVPGYMASGAEQWSTVNKKACPGDRRIAQIPAIVTRAQNILKGVSRMATLDAEDLTNIARAVWGFQVAGQKVQAQDRLFGMDSLALPGLKELVTGYGRRTEDIQARLTALQTLVTELSAHGEVSAAAIEEAVSRALKENVVSVDVAVKPRPAGA
jgi:hypothetical protein